MCKLYRVSSHGDQPKLVAYPIVLGERLGLERPDGTVFYPDLSYGQYATTPYHAWMRECRVYRKAVREGRAPGNDKRFAYLELLLKGLKEARA